MWNTRIGRQRENCRPFSLINNNTTTLKALPFCFPFLVVMYNYSHKSTWERPNRKLALLFLFSHLLILGMSRLLVLAGTGNVDILPETNSGLIPKRKSRVVPRLVALFLENQYQSRLWCDGDLTGCMVFFLYWLICKYLSIIFQKMIPPKKLGRQTFISAAQDFSLDFGENLWWQSTKLTNNSQEKSIKQTGSFSFEKILNLMNYIHPTHLLFSEFQLVRYDFRALKPLAVTGGIRRCEKIINDLDSRHHVIGKLVKLLLHVLCFVVPLSAKLLGLQDT
jgi:hypothetical protein